MAADALESEPLPQWACSSAGRAPALQAGGRGFESPHVHQNFTPLLSATYAATSSPDFAPDFLGAFGTITAASPLFPHSPDVTFGKSKPYSTRSASAR